MSTRRDGEIIVGWRIRVNVLDKAFLAPLAVDGRDMYEYELEATNVFNDYVAAGADASLEPVWGVERRLKKVPGPAHPCHWHEKRNSRRQVVIGDLEPVYACESCTDKMVSLGAEVIS